MTTSKPEKAHAKYSPSSAKRWMNCPGSIALCEKAPPEIESKYAKEGTEAHKCLEYLLRNRDTPQVSTMMARKKFGTEMTDHALSTVWEVNRRLKEAGPGAELFIEQKGNLDFIAPDMGGTADVVIAQHFGRLTVIDYKYGVGVAVDPDVNEQLISYALQEAHKFDYNFNEICLVIAQPRATHHKGPVREWLTNIQNLESWSAKFKYGVKQCEKPDAPLMAGKWCKFCRAAPICPEISNKALREAQIEFNEVTKEIQLPFPATTAKLLTPARISETLTAFESLDVWMDEFRKFAFGFLEQGNTIPGFKLVPKQGRRQWVDAKKTETAAKKKFGDKALTAPELLSPAQLEKIAGKEWVGERVAVVSSGVTLARDDDKRPATHQAALDFAAPVATVDKRTIPFRPTLEIPKKKPKTTAPFWFKEKSHVKQQTTSTRRK